MSNPVFVQHSPEIQKLISHYSQQLTAAPAGAKGLLFNWSEVFTKFIASVTGGVLASPTGSLADKKQAVIEAAMSFWQQTGKQLAAGAVGHPFIFNYFIAPFIEQQIPVLVGGIFDALVAVLNKVTGQGGQTTTTTQPGGGFIPY